MSTPRYRPLKEDFCFLVDAVLSTPHPQGGEALREGAMSTPRYRPLKEDFCFLVDEVRRGSEGSALKCMT